MLACCARSDPVAAELACQQRLVDISSAGGPAAETFARISRGYREMDLEGCSEDQRSAATAMARAAAEVDAMWRRLGDPVRRMESEPELVANADFLELQDRIEGWERRRQLLRRDLEALAAIK